MSVAAGAMGSLLGLDDLACPICVETIEDAFATPCGHTFCYKCISTHLKNKSNCPSCGAHLIQDHIYPNFLLRKLIKQAANNRPSLKTALLQHVQQDLAVGTSKIPLQELDSAIKLLQERRQQVVTHEGSNKLQLLLLFLQHAKAKQQGKLSELEQQLEVLQQDLDKAMNEQQQQQQQQQPESKEDEQQQACPATAAAAAASSAGAQGTGQCPLEQGHIDAAQQQQQQQVTRQQPAIGGAGSAFRRLPQQAAIQQQHQQQPGLQQPIQQQQQQQQPPQAMLRQPLQQQQQQQGFRPVGFQPVNGQGFRPFVPKQSPQQQQAMQAPMQPPQPPPQQPAGFRPYSGGLGGGLRTASSSSLQQQQQQQRSAFQMPNANAQGVPDAAAAAAAGSRSLNVDKKRKILDQFDELQQAYMNTRVRRTSASSEQASPPAAAAAAAAAAVTGSKAAQQLQEEASAMQAGQTQQAQHVIRQQQHLPLPAAAAGVAAVGGNALAAFSNMLAAVTSDKKLQHVAYIPPSSSKAGTSSSSCNILSSIAFDCRGHLFAAAGVQQRICIYDYDAIMAAAAAEPQDHPHPPAAAAAGSGGSALAPLLDLPTRSKISCTSFNPVVQHYLLSSDYEGLVHLWDMNGGRIVRQWQAHEKRIWAVDSCRLVQDQFATGSDDGLVKIWGLREPPVPRATLTVKVNVCSLEYNPMLPHLLAVGSAGHQVHLFDLRMPRSALATLRGHRKAVSYVRWAGGEQLVTASTDSTLRLWAAAAGKGSSDTAAAAAAAASGGATSSGPWPSGSGSSGEQQQQGGWQCTQVFRGHTNMKHFVGLSPHGEYVACGSETNEVFVYHQGLPTPSLQYKLSIPPAPDTAAAAAAAAGSSHSTAAGSSSKSPFVSAVTWRRDSDVLLAANSQGGIWVLSLAANDGVATGGQSD